MAKNFMCCGYQSMDFWHILIILLTAALIYRLVSSNKEGYMASNAWTTPTASTTAKAVTLPAVVGVSPCSLAGPDMQNVPSFDESHAMAVNQMNRYLDSTSTTQLQPKDLLPPVDDSCSRSSDLNVDIANYTLAIGVGRVGAVSVSAPKRFMTQDIRGMEKVPDNVPVGPWNNSPIRYEDIPQNRPLC